MGQDDHQSAGQYYRRLLRLAFVHWKIFTVSIVGMILVAGTDTALAAFMKPLVDVGFVDKDKEMVRMLPLMLVGIFVVRVFAMFISMYCISWVGRRVIMVLRARMFNKLLLLPKDFYDNATSGEIISKFTFDVEQVANASTKAITILVRDTFTVIGVLAWMFYLSVPLTLVLLTTVPLIALLVTVVTKKFRKLSKRIQGSIGDVSRIVEESIKAQIVVKVFGGRGYEEFQFDRINDQNRRQNMRLIATQALSTPVIRLIVGIGLAVIIYLVTRDDSMNIVSAGTFASYMASLIFLFGPVKRLADVNVDLQRGIAAAESVFKLTDLEGEVDSGSYTTDRVNGDIRFSQVGFRYRSAKEAALTDIKLEVRAGETLRGHVAGLHELEGELEGVGVVETAADDDDALHEAVARGEVAHHGSLGQRAFRRFRQLFEAVDLDVAAEGVREQIERQQLPGVGLGGRDALLSAGPNEERRLGDARHRALVLVGDAERHGAGLAGGFQASVYVSRLA